MKIDLNQAIENKENEDNSSFDINQNKFYTFSSDDFPVYLNDFEFGENNQFLSIYDNSKVYSFNNSEFSSFYLSESDNKNIRNEADYENEINSSRLKYLHENVSSKFLKLIIDEDFEFGYTSRSEEMLLSLISINEIATLNWLNELFVSNFSKSNITCGIMRLVGRLSEHIVKSTGYTMALASLTHKDDEVKELGVRAFENWSTSKSLEILKSTEVETKWLREYIINVISDLNKVLCPSL